MFKEILLCAQNLLINQGSALNLVWQAYMIIEEETESSL